MIYNIDSSTSTSDVNEEDVSYRIVVTKETENNSRRPNSDSFSSELKYHAEATVLSYAR